MQSYFRSDFYVFSSTRFTDIRTHIRKHQLPSLLLLNKHIAFKCPNTYKRSTHCVAAMEAIAHPSEEGVTSDANLMASICWMEKSMDKPREFVGARNQSDVIWLLFFHQTVRAYTYIYVANWAVCGWSKVSLAFTHKMVIVIHLNFKLHNRNEFQEDVLSSKFEIAHWCI